MELQLADGSNRVLKVDTLSEASVHELVAYEAELVRWAALQTEYIDLYYLHAHTPNVQLLTATWRALEDLQHQGGRSGPPPDGSTVPLLSPEF